MGFLVLLALLAFGAGSSSSAAGRGLAVEGSYQGIYWRLWHGRHTMPDGRVATHAPSWQLQLWWDVGGGCSWVTFGEYQLRPSDAELDGWVRETIGREWSENAGGAMVSASCPPP